MVRLIAILYIVFYNTELVADQMDRKIAVEVNAGVKNLGVSLWVGDIGEMQIGVRGISIERTVNIAGFHESSATAEILSLNYRHFITDFLYLSPGFGRLLMMEEIKPVEGPVYLGYTAEGSVIKISKQFTSVSIGVMFELEGGSFHIGGDAIELIYPHGGNSGTSLIGGDRHSYESALDYTKKPFYVYQKINFSFVF